LGLVSTLFWASLTLGPLLSGAGVFGWQVYSWLSTGDWKSVSLLDFMRWAGSHPEWTETPTTWMGLWKLLNWIPLSVTLLLLGVIASAALMAAQPKADPYAAFWKQMRQGGVDAPPN